MDIIFIPLKQHPLCLQEYRLTDEQIDPELLKILDDVFEFQLPLYNTVMDFKTEVGFYLIIVTMSLHIAMCTV